MKSYTLPTVYLLQQYTLERMKCYYVLHTVYLLRQCAGSQSAGCGQRGRCRPWGGWLDGPGTPPWGDGECSQSNPQPADPHCQQRCKAESLGRGQRDCGRGYKETAKSVTHCHQVHVETLTKRTLYPSKDGGASLLVLLLTNMSLATAL